MSMASMPRASSLGTMRVEGQRYLEQASFVTGEILHVDGGQSAGH